MLKVSGSDIYLTRGDSASLVVSVQYVSGESYQPVTGDCLLLTVKRSVDDLSVLMIKASAGWSEQGRAVIEFTPGDTKALSFGNYVYDLELRTAGGAVHTIVTPSAFRIGEEVG